MIYLQVLLMKGNIGMSALEDMIRWIPTHIKIQDKFDKTKKNLITFKVPSGAIYTCHLGQNIGYEKSKLEARPCLVVSTNRLNYHSGNVIVVPLTSTIKYKQGSTSELIFDWHYVLKQSTYSFLKNDSCVCCEDIRSINKARLGKYMGQVNVTDMKNIRKRLKSALQL